MNKMKNGVPEKKINTLSQTELIKKLEAWFEACSEPFPLGVTGHSMTPFIAPGRDTAFLSPFEGSVKKGDVILFVSRKGRLLLHRVIRVKGSRVYTAGDAYPVCDEGTEVSGIIAVCRKVSRKGRLYTEKSPYWKFFSKIWIRVMPLRGRIMRLISKK